MVAQSTLNAPEARQTPLFRPAQHQTTHSSEELLHSGNSGLIIHRVGQVNYGFRREGREFAVALQQHLNKALHPQATTLLYEELFGTEDRLHWLMHMKAPNDYAKLLVLVDHDPELKEIADGDRLPERGGGNWERMFAEASFHEAVMVPQHGVTHADEGALDGLFVPPARYQTAVGDELLLHSASAGVIVHRRAQVKFKYREEGRRFAFEWQDHINRVLAGDVTVFLYEETWGRQDRIHWLLHLHSLDDYRKLIELSRHDAEYQDIFARQRIPHSAGGGTWSDMFVDGTLKNRVLAPHQEGIIGWP